MRSRTARRILVPHDFSPAADRALRQAAALARTWRARVRVIYAIAPLDLAIPVPHRVLPEPHDLVPQQQQALARRVRTVLGPKAPPVAVEVAVGQPTDVILNAARDADMIVMATEGRTGLQRFVLGSVAERVVRRAPIPVLTIGARSAPGRVARNGASRPAT